MSGSVQEFTVALTRHQELFGKQCDLLVQGFVQTVFNEIQSGGRYSPGTPIDTGQARANWFGGIGAEGQMDAAGTAAAAKAGDVVIIANNLPYIRRLEFGWSQQAPQGMVRLALLGAQQITEEVAAHVFAMRA